MLVSLVPRVSDLWTVHSANEVTPCTDCNLDPALAAYQISPIKHCQVAHAQKHIHHCR